MCLLPNFFFLRLLSLYVIKFYVPHNLGVILNKFQLILKIWAVGTWQHYKRCHKYAKLHSDHMNLNIQDVGLEVLARTKYF